VGPVRILWVKANKLLPVHSGGDIRTYHIARELASRHSLTFFSYYDGDTDPVYERLLAEQLPGAVCLSTGRVGSRTARFLDYLKRLPSGAPYAVSRFQFAGVVSKLRLWYRDKSFDRVVCDFLDAAVNFPDKLTLPSVLFQHNVESEIWRRHADLESNPGKRLVYSMEFKRMLAYEQTAVNRFHHVVAVSEHDRKLMSAWVDQDWITVVPTGVDLAQYAPDHSGREPQPMVLFVGAMDWEPNIDAVEYFCKEIWPQVVAKIPSARFRIVGRNPDQRVKSLGLNSIEVTGRVPSVIDHLWEAAVVVVPLRVAGGTRLKIYEAMAAGKAVVSTSVGAEGLEVHDGRNIVLADAPGVFAEAVVTLLRDRNLRRKYEGAATELAAGHSWQDVGKKFEAVLESVADLATPLQPAVASVLRPMEGPIA
jgi:polysaccharide biosynthesis protein PslH